MEKIIAYRVTRSGGSGWMFAGVTIQEVLDTLKTELEVDFGEGHINDRDCLTIVPYLTTQERIDALPEFEGW